VKCGHHEDDVIVSRDGVEKMCPNCDFFMKKKPSRFHPVFNGNGWTEKIYKRGAA
jgi:predicted nucleic acid-binding Zn ribbon protein